MVNGLIFMGDRKWQKNEALSHRGQSPSVLGLNRSRANHLRNGKNATSVRLAIHDLILPLVLLQSLNLNDSIDTHMDNGRHDLLLSVQRSIRYHMRRRSFYEGREQISKILALIIGPMIALAVHYQLPSVFSVGTSILITSFAVWNLISETVRMSQLHYDLARRFVDLEEQMAQAPEPTIEQMNHFRALRLRIEKDEPPKLRVFDIRCLNEIILARGYDRGELWEIPWLTARIGVFFDIDDTNIDQAKNKKRKQ